MSTSLADASNARKERLLALRKRKAGELNEADGAADSKSFAFKQRNYDPETRTLKKHSKADIGNDTVENAVKGLAEQIVLEDEERRAQELDLFNIAPKRPNWDLKRDIEKKLAKLERKTQESIHLLIRQRLAGQKNPTSSLNFSASIKASEQAARDDAMEVDSDEED